MVLQDADRQGEPGAGGGAVTLDGELWINTGSPVKQQGDKNCETTGQITDGSKCHLKLSARSATSITDTAQDLATLPASTESA